MDNKETGYDFLERLKKFFFEFFRIAKPKLQKNKSQDGESNLENEIDSNKKIHDIRDLEKDPEFNYNFEKDLDEAIREDINNVSHDFSTDSMDSDDTWGDTKTANDIKRDISDISSNLNVYSDNSENVWNHEKEDKDTISNITEESKTISSEKKINKKDKNMKDVEFNPWE